MKKPRLGNAGCFCAAALVSCIYYYLAYLRVKHSGITEQTWRAAFSLGPFLYMIGVMIASLLCVMLFVCGQTLISKKTQIKVFVAHQHQSESLAAEIKEALRNFSIVVSYVPFSECADHDTVIDRCRNMLSSSDAVIVLPGRTEAWVDHEIFAATTLKKVVVPLKVSADQTTPNSLLQGYPMFNFEKLRAKQFRPLADFLLYACNSWRDTRWNFLRVLGAFGGIVAAAGAAYIPLRVFFGFMADLFFWINPLWKPKIESGLAWVCAVFISLAFILAYVYLVATRLRAIKIARQKCLTRECTFEGLAGSLEVVSGEIVSCLEREPLPLRH